MKAKGTMTNRNAFLKVVLAAVMAPFIGKSKLPKPEYDYSREDQGGFIVPPEICEKMLEFFEKHKYTLELRANVDCITQADDDI